ncbi:hypothetical protein [Haloferax sp. DFSO52]|uniref:hypothetical protein n=1 Tax=Haloferax sp. DFSO52 TaxID=3388505 RepID=UPI003A83CC33
MVVSRYATILLFPPLGFVTGVLYLLFVEGAIGFEGVTSLAAMIGSAVCLGVFASVILQDSLSRGVVNVFFTVLGAVGLFLFSLTLPGV